MARSTELTKKLEERAEKYIDVLARYELPSHDDLATFLEIAESSLDLWRDVDTDLGGQFAETLANIKTFQHYQALNRGLKGDWNSTIVKLVLAKHGYVERRETDLTTKGKELPTPILDGLTQHESGDLPSDHRDS